MFRLLGLQRLTQHQVCASLLQRRTSLSGAQNNREEIAVGSQLSRRFEQETGFKTFIPVHDDNVQRFAGQRFERSEDLWTGFNA
jgi:hypothetical protein